MIGIQKALQRILFVTLLLSIITGLVLQGVHTVNKNKEEEKIIETQKKKDLKDMERIKGMNEITLEEIENRKQEEYDKYVKFVAWEKQKEQQRLDEIERQKEAKRVEQRETNSVKNLSRGSGNMQGKRVTFNVSAYTLAPSECGKSPSHPYYGITASGTKVQAGRTIAAGSGYPFGTKIYIPYFDTVFTVEDRGGAISNGHIDVYMTDASEMRSFGRRNLECIVLD